MNRPDPPAVTSHLHTRAERPVIELLDADQAAALERLRTELRQAERDRVRAPDKAQRQALNAPDVPFRVPES
jgi:hypothetical protein